MSKHTPGPWSVLNYYCSGERHTVADTNGKDLCRFDSSAGGWALKEADARLIAAAPEMLALLLHIRETGHVTPHWARMLSVIAKAEGSTGPGDSNGL